MTTRANHCCPICHHPVGAGRWFWRAWIWARWNCGSCGSLLRFDFGRRLLFALFFGVILVTAFGIAAACMLLQISPWIWTIPLLAAFIFAFAFLVLNGDRVVEATPSSKNGSQAPLNNVQPNATTGLQMQATMTKCIRVEGSPGFQCNGGDVIVSQSEGQASVTTPNVIVHCHGVLITRFGYPNDEALAGDPLYPTGLKFYDVVEVINSPWLRDINDRNRTRFPNFRGYAHKHYFMAFHDSSFEVLCSSITFDSIEPCEIA